MKNSILWILGVLVLIAIIVAVALTLSKNRPSASSVEPATAAPSANYVLSKCNKASLVTTKARSQGSTIFQDLGGKTVLTWVTLQGNKTKTGTTVTLNVIQQRYLEVNNTISAGEVWNGTVALKSDQYSISKDGGKVTADVPMTEWLGGTATWPVQGTWTVADTKPVIVYESSNKTQWGITYNAPAQVTIEGRSYSFTPYDGTTDSGFSEINIDCYK